MHSNIQRPHAMALPGSSHPFIFSPEKFNHLITCDFLKLILSPSFKQKITCFWINHCPPPHPTIFFVVDSHALWMHWAHPYRIYHQTAGIQCMLRCLNSPDLNHECLNLLSSAQHFPILVFVNHFLNITASNTHYSLNIPFFQNGPLTFFSSSWSNCHRL